MPAKFPGHPSSDFGLLLLLSPTYPHADLMAFLDLCFLFFCYELWILSSTSKRGGLEDGGAFSLSDKHMRHLQCNDP